MMRLIVHHAFLECSDWLGTKLMQSIADTINFQIRSNTGEIQKDLQWLKDNEQTSTGFIEDLAMDIWRNIKQRLVETVRSW